MSRFVFAVLFLLMVSGCSKPTEVTPVDRIVGSWRWVRTQNAWTGVETPPAGEVHHTEFTLHQTYRELVDDRVRRSGTYRVTTESDSTGDIFFDGGTLATGYRIDGDTLGIGNPEVDGPLKVFVRIR